MVERREFFTIFSLLNDRLPSATNTGIVLKIRSMMQTTEKGVQATSRRFG